MGVKKLHTQSGFTLLELVIVLTILGILVPATFAMFMANLRAQTKVLILQEVKKNGDAALDVFEAMVNSQAESLEQEDGTAICNTSGSDYTGIIYFVEPDGDRFAFFEQDGQIMLESATTDSLTSDRVTVSAFQTSCARESQFTSPIISISFTVEQSQVTTRAEEMAELNYQTKIRLRSL